MKVLHNENMARLNSKEGCRCDMPTIVWLYHRPAIKKTMPRSWTSKNASR